MYTALTSGWWMTSSALLVDWDMPWRLAKSAAFSASRAHDDDEFRVVRFVKSRATFDFAHITTTDDAPFYYLHWESPFDKIQSLFRFKTFCNFDGRDPPASK